MGEFPCAHPKLSICNTFLQSPGPIWEGMALLCPRTPPFLPQTPSPQIPSHHLPFQGVLLPSPRPQQSTAWGRADLALGAPPLAPTIFAEVPDTQSPVPRRRHQDEASIGSEAQVPDDVLVPQEAEEKVSCGEQPYQPCQRLSRAGAGSSSRSPSGNI